NRLPPCSRLRGGRHVLVTTPRYFFPPGRSAAQPRTPRMPPIMTGLSGNEIYCLGLKGFAPGELVVGNSVHSLGFLGGLGAGLKGIMGGEVEQVTEIIREGRLQSHARIMQEA